MLKELSIHHIAIIKDEQLAPGEGLTVLTGETGAGKSIIIDSVGLIMGERASRELIRGGETKAMVSALFDNVSSEVCVFAADLGVEAEDSSFLFQRDITDKGGSTARINGRTVPLTLMREIAAKLINIHGQHASESLLNEETHIRFLDAFADIAANAAEYSVLYEEMLAITRRIAAITHDEQEKARTIEQLKFQIKDIDSVNPKEGEEEELKAKRTKLQNAEKIAKYAKLIYRALYQTEKGLSACDLIDKAIEAIGALDDVIAEAPAFAETLTDFRYRIEDIAETIRGECDIGVKNPSELLDKIEERLDDLKRLYKKYGTSVAEIREYRNRAAAKLHDLESADEICEDLENEKREVCTKLKAIAAEITAKRRAAAKLLEEKITSELMFLDMEKVRFRIEVLPLSDFAPDGMDKVAFLVSANPGEPLLPLSKVASGGELSRMMLALRCAFADKERTATLIFDEIDTGISGRTSHRIGVKLKEVASSGTQVICITHSPQIAAVADTHLFVQKREVDGRTESSVRVLLRSEREEEIARIIGGAEITEQTRLAARELLDANM